MKTYDEFPDPAPIIREWLKQNRSYDPAMLAQFNTFVAQECAHVQPGAGMFAWLAIAFAAGREYGETKNSTVSP